MENFVDLRLKPETLSHFGLPDIAYPVSLDAFQEATTGNDLPLADLLYALQDRSRVGEQDWKQYEASLDRLACLIAPNDTREIVSAEGDTWWLEVGPINLDREIVTVQRESDLIAAIRPCSDGRLRIAVFRPLDAKSINSLISLSVRPHPEGGVCMRENNWEYARDSAAGTGNMYASMRGEAYLSYWKNGIGLSHDGSEVEAFRSQRDLKPRRGALVATEIGIHYELSAAPHDDDTAHADVSNTPTPSESPSRQSDSQPCVEIKERFLGCLIGGAVGDALGAPIEFMKRSEILQRFGPGGATTYASAYGRLGAITDDTQMTLFTAEGLLRGWVRGQFKGITSYSAVVSHAYLRWLKTQGSHSNCDIDFGNDEPGWLFQQRDLHARRAPGNTCLSALIDKASLEEPACNNSKGCGGVMRVAPVGLFAWQLKQTMSSHDTFQLGTELAALTHGHPTGSLTGGVLAVMIMELTDGASLNDALAIAKQCLTSEREHEETLCAIEMAEEFARSDTDPHQAIARLGEGWIAEEALAISIYCALIAKDFKQGVIYAVNHDGDSDSTGAITGNILGALYGHQAIPEEWLEPLELRNVISEIAEDLCAFSQWNIGDYGDSVLSEKVWKKYPGF